jgi:cyanophycinase
MTHKTLSPVLFVLLAFLLSGCANSSGLSTTSMAWQGVPGAMGHLVMVGGGSRPDSIMRHILSLSADNSMLIIPMASEAPEETGKAQAEEFRLLGAQRAEVLLLPTIDSSTAATTNALAGQIAAAKGIWFSGGDQNRLMDYLGDGALLTAVRQAYQQGAVISGTSAGTAVISNTMITGDEAYPAEDHVFGVLVQNNVVTAPGIGLLNNMIVDQHFLIRSRLNRLISVLLDSQEFLAAGIDEATALWIGPDGQSEVLGESQVVLLQKMGDADSITMAGDHRGLPTQADSPVLQAARDVRLSVLPPASRFRITDTGIQSLQLPGLPPQS